VTLEHDLIRKAATVTRAHERLLREVGSVLRGYEVLLSACAHAIHHHLTVAGGPDVVKSDPVLGAHLKLAQRIDRLLATRLPPDQPVDGVDPDPAPAQPVRQKSTAPDPGPQGSGTAPRPRQTGP
jgi:hypothetical protein